MVMSVHERFGQLIAVVIAIALDNDVFQTVFDMIMILLITMEFKHSIVC